MKLTKILLIIFLAVTSPLVYISNFIIKIGIPPLEETIEQAMEVYFSIFAKGEKEE